ncbi:MAG: aspartate aminotransferase family protein [Desulfobacterales bacterium]|jgi:adenosylmethionine-8-amino-7-oxononanoate aminotransferase
MENNGIRMDNSAHLILHITPKSTLEGGVTIIERGQGVEIFDSDGNRYLDLVAGVTRPVHVGYGRRELAQAVYDQICQLSYFTPMAFANIPAMKLARLLAEITPGSLNRFTFECGGSEAVETAMKLAKHYHFFKGEKGRFKIISRRGAYHGVNGIGLRALGSVPAMRQVMEPLAPGSIFVDSPYCYRCPLGLIYPDCDTACARNVEQIIEFEGPEYISAFIGEPIQQAYGALAPPPEYWPIVRDICDTYGILLIIDEVICGFGRTGKMFGIEHFATEADLITMAKGLTSGYVPLGAAGCTDRVWQPIEVFNHLHTYGNHPVPCAAALKNIAILQNEKLVENAAAMGAYLLNKLRELQHHPIVGEVRGTGLFVAIDFTTDKKTRAALPFDHIANMVTRAKRKGVIVKFAPGRMAIELAPPLVIQKEEIDRALRILDEVIAEEEKKMGI